MKLSILTPETTVFEGEIDSLVVPGAFGLFGILKNHVPILSSVTPGVLNFKQGETIVNYHIGGGFLEFNSNEATVLADSIESPDDIDINRVDQSIKRAKKRMKDHGNFDIDRAQRSLMRALSRRKTYSAHN